MTELCYVLDSEALSRAALGDMKMRARLADAHKAGVSVVTSSMTLIEAYHSKIPYAAWKWFLSRIEVEPVTEEIADSAITLLKGAGLHGHKYAIDAALAVIAGRRRGIVTVFTSDEDDMNKLCPSRVVVRPV
ncbi:type II toxin-antitoxin system VapC family toxin [Streptomyces sp. NPDC048718]|uniref:type II toxin-antitoxin system VapC family toxin n=1 Tax=Streptomyces sp. NPDC048718 TaxID=3365587 RepID=UPI00371A4577